MNFVNALDNMVYPSYFCQSITLVIVLFVSENHYIHRVFHKIGEFWTLSDKIHFDKNCVLFSHQKKWTYDVNDIFSLNFKSLLWWLHSSNTTFQSSNEMKFITEWRICIFQKFTSTKLVEIVRQNFYRKFDVREFLNLL